MPRLGVDLVISRPEVIAPRAILLLLTLLSAALLTGALVAGTVAPMWLVFAVAAGFSISGSV